MIVTFAIAVIAFLALCALTAACVREADRFEEEQRKR